MNLQHRTTRRRVLALAGTGVLGALTAPRLVFAQNKHAVKFTLP